MTSEDGSIRTQIQSLRDLQEQRWTDHRERHSFSDGAMKERAEAAQTAIATALLAQEKAVNAALTAAKEAVLKAEVAAEKRFESVNEFRATLADQQRSLMPRNEAEIKFNAIEGSIKLLTERYEKTANVGAGKHDATTFNLTLGFFVLGLFTLAVAVFKSL